MRFGLNSGYDGLTPHNLNRIVNMGGDSIRCPFSWWWNDWPVVDRLLADCREANLQPIICIFFAAPDHPSHTDFATAAQAFVHRYPNVPTWQLLNEPNSDTYGGISAGDAAAYVTHATAAIHEVNRNVEVLAPAMTPALPGHRAYARAMHQEIPNHLRVHPAIHFYPTGKKPIHQLGSEIGVAKQLGTGRVHVTEAGIMHNHYGNDQPSLSAAALATADRTGAHAMIFHCAITGPAPDDWHQQTKLAVLERPKLYEALKTARTSLTTADAILSP